MHAYTHLHKQMSIHTHVRTHPQVIAFSDTLRLRRPTLGDDCQDAHKGAADFRLIATISHHGKHAAGGHYTADVMQPDGTWWVGERQA